MIKSLPIFATVFFIGTSVSVLADSKYTNPPYDNSRVPDIHVPDVKQSGTTVTGAPTPGGGGTVIINRGDSQYTVHSDGQGGGKATYDGHF